MQKKKNGSQLSSENVKKNFASFVLINSDVFSQCACCFLIFLQRSNVLPAVLFTFAYRLPNFSYFKLVLGLFQIHSEKLSTRTTV